MTQYEFRGYSLSTQEWVYGNLWQANLIASNGRIHIVKENTVGLYSGLYDSVGKKIFENDILKIGKSYYRVCFSYGSYYIRNMDSYETYDLYETMLDHTVEVIGNIYEEVE